MKKFIYVLAAFVFSPSAFAVTLTVPMSDVAGKISEVGFRQVELSSGATTILTDAAGLSVYTFDADENDKSNCSGGCLTVWPAVRVTSEGEIPAPFGRILGNDGLPQLTLLGQPLYYYIKDKAAGDVFGDYPGWHPVVVTE